MKFSAAAPWCVAFLICFRLLITCAGADPTLRGDILNAAEHLRGAEGKDLRVVFFGSSRLHSAILPDEWARLAGLQPGQVVNLAVSNGRLWEALFMLDRAGGMPASVELAVIEISPWEFNRNLVNPICNLREGVPVHMRTWATLSDRLAVDGIGSKVSLLADWIWPVYRRIPLEKWEFPRPPFELKPLLPPAHHWNQKDRETMANLVAFRGDKIAASHFWAPSYSSFAQRNLERLISRLGNGSLRLVLLQLPARQSYIDAIKSDARTKALYDRARALVRASGSEHVSLVSWELPGDCGLSEDTLVDYGHFSREGAVAFTNRLFLELEAH